LDWSRGEQSAIRVKDNRVFSVMLILFNYLVLQLRFTPPYDNRLTT